MEFINTITGEIYDLSSDTSLIDAYFAVKEMNGKAKKMNEKLNEFLAEKVKGKEYVQVSVYQLRPTIQECKEYPVSALRNVFDEDQLMECLKPVNKKVEEMMGLLDEEGRKELMAATIKTQRILPPKLV